jgi:hypothetical protein
MSHFTVLVIGENPQEQLRPFHEFECTGIDDQYIKDIDITENIRKEFEAATTTMYKSPDGKLHKPFGDEFYREPTREESKKIGIGSGFGKDISWYSKDWNDGRGYRAKIHFMPEGWQEVEIKKSDLMSFAKYCVDGEGKPQITEAGLGFEMRENDGKVSDAYKYGYTVIDPHTREVVRVIDRTNPNKKWDWYKLGGRWTGFFKLKPVKLIGNSQVHDAFMGFTAGEMENFVDMYKTNKAKFAKVCAKYATCSAALYKKVSELATNQSILPPHDIGSPGLMTSSAPEGYADAAMKKYIDFEFMRNEAAEKAAALYDKAMQLFGHLPPNRTWEDVRESGIPIDEARNLYNSQARVVACQGHDDFAWDGPDEFLMPREQYLQAARKRAISTFAVIKDGKWYEKGEMGWWGAVSDEKDQEVWNMEFNKLLDSVSDDTMLSVYDCHI